MSLSCFSTPALVGAALLLSAVVAGAAAPFEAFIKFGPVVGQSTSLKGESVDAQFHGTNGWSRVLGFEEEGENLSALQPGSKAGTDRQNLLLLLLHPLTVVKAVDGASTALFQSCASGGKLKYVLVALRAKAASGSGARPFYFAKAEGVGVTRMQWVYDSDELPLEKIALSELAFQWTVGSESEGEPIGSVSSYWDSRTSRSGYGPLPGLELFPESLGTASIGRRYQQTFNVSGGAAPYHFWIDGGLLPDGTSLSAEGVLSGSPTRLGQFTFRVAGEDNTGSFAERWYTLIVSSGPRFQRMEANQDLREWKVHLEATPGRYLQIESASDLSGAWRTEGGLVQVPASGLLEVTLNVDRSPARFIRGVESLSGCPDLPTGLIHWWRGESELDLIAEGPVGSTGSPQRVAGPFGESFLFDGHDDQFELVTADRPEAVIEAGWTLAVWVRREDSIDASSALLLDSRTAFKLEQYGLPARQVGITWFGHWDRRFAYSAPVGEWVHLVLTDTASGTALYVDGRLSEVIRDRIPLPLNRMGGGVGDRLRGAVDEMLVFNRALSAQEIDQLYQASSRLGNCDPVSLSR